ncbi:insulinase family protein [bacterium]|nr:MAG: insulinase family protein [bacterium]
MIKARKIKLRNGLRIILVPQPESLATTAMVAVQAGSKYETKNLNGISHFLEHMCFKGTTKRPKPIDISAELDGLGAQYNAFTSQESTAYYAKAKNENFDQILDVVADMYLNPTFDSNEIEKEKGVIIQELNMYEDTPARRAGELFMQLVYGDQPAGWDIGGRKEVIKKITRNDFVKYRGRHYVPQATVVTISGGFKERGLVKKIERYFSVLKPGFKSKKLKVKEVQSRPREKVHFKESDQTHLVMGFRAFGIHDERRLALQVAAEVLGGGMSSRLFQKIRDELGAAYYVRAEADLYSDHGLFTMSAGVDHAKLDAVIKAGLKEFGRLRDELVSEKDLKKAKEHLIGGLYLSLETSDELAYFYGGQEIMGLKLTSPQELAGKINKITVADIRNVARAVVKNDRLNLALIGPFKKKSFLNIAKV